MNIETNSKFNVVIDGKQSGRIGSWNHTPLSITSTWDAGSDQEKFEVLTAIRRTYNPDNKADIRGNQGQTPSQIGRCEGFKELRYGRTETAAPAVVIVPAVMQYLRAAPQPKTVHGDESLSRNG